MKSFLSALRDGYVADIDATSTVYAGFGPVERPDAYVQLIPAGGIPLEWPGGEWRIGQFQVVHVGRVTAIRAALEAAEAAYEALHERVNWELDGYRARFVECLQVPMLLGGPDGGQARVVFNMRTVAKRVDEEKS